MTPRFDDGGGGGRLMPGVSGSPEVTVAWMPIRRSPEVPWPLLVLAWAAQQAAADMRMVRSRMIGSLERGLCMRLSPLPLTENTRTARTRHDGVFPGVAFG